MSTEGRLHAFIILLALMILNPGVASAESWPHEGGELVLDKVPQRIVALNWAATEALLLLGVTPVGVADRDGYPYWVQEPPLPDGIYNVGTRSAPSLEAIAELDPDLIVTSGQLAPARSQLKALAPTYIISVYDKGTSPLEQATRMLITLGDMLNREKQAEEALASLDRTLARNRDRLAAAGLSGAPVALVNFMDDRHVRINAPNGIFQAALDGLGLRNAWQQNGNFWGFAMVGLEDLAPLEDAHLVAISPVPPGLDQQLSQSPFWTHLPAVQQRRVYQIDPVWAYGGIYAVHRMSELLTEALLTGGTGDVR